jgi:hypothetical protein
LKGGDPMSSEFTVKMGTLVRIRPSRGQSL